jgi:hypothetical protein
MSGRGHERRPLQRRRPVDFRYAPFATEDAWRRNMVAKGHMRTHALQHTAASFNHLVGATE